MRRSQPVLIGIIVIALVTLAFESGSASWTDHVETPLIQDLPDSFNVQIQAIEVTQGVRGDIPTRVPPNGDLTFHQDGAVHIANRQTIVRVYPWVESSSSTTVPPLKARLWAFRDGVLLPDSPIYPENDTLTNIIPGQSLETMRNDAEASWNFILPETWVTGSLEHKSFTLRFIVEANPPGRHHIPECQGCTTDNQVSLGGQEFVIVPPLVIKPYFVQHTLMDRDGSLVVFPGPTQDEFDTAIQNIQAMLPVGNLGQGLVILTPKHIDWQGPLYSNGVHVFAETMIQKYLPGGSLTTNQDRIYHIFLFSSSSKHNFLVNYKTNGMRLGLAWNGKNYVQSGTRSLELVHELTHALGLSHAGNKNGEATTNPDYPDEYGQVEPNAFGFDIWEMRAIPPVSGESVTHDYMSYNSTDPAWVSIYTWKTIAQILGQLDLEV